MWDRIRRALCMLLCAALSWLFTGCSFGGSPTTVQTVRPKAVVTPEPKLEDAPAMLLTSVLTDKRVVSLVFEGYTDDTSMRALLDAVKKTGVPCIFFISGIEANEHPEVVKEIADAGLTIGNYAINAPKNMQDNDVSQNIHQFQRGQELIGEVANIKPTLFRCNGTEYTKEVLQAAAHVGLKAGINPGVYLNHRSFDQKSDASLFVTRLTRGSIISVKLGQELDASEYDGVAEEYMRNLEIDPLPFLSDNMTELITATYANTANVVIWLLEALNSEGYIVLSPEALQAERLTMFDSPLELGEETSAMLDPEAYALPVAQAPLETFTGAPAGDEALDGAVFVGDSLTAGLKDYVEWRRETDGAFLGTAQFLTANNLGVVASQMRVTSDSAHPTVDGVKMTVEAGLKAMDAKTVYLMPGIGDVRGYTKEKLIENLKLLIYQIRNKNPGVWICLQSIPPGVQERLSEPSNMKIFQYNLAVFKFCLQYGIPFFDPAFALRDEKGDLRADLCIDSGTYGLHLNDAGCEKWIDSIRNHLP